MCFQQKQSDGGAAEAARIQAEMQREALAQNERLLKEQQEQAAATLAEQQQTAAAEEAARQAELATAQAAEDAKTAAAEEAARQQVIATKSTGTPSVSPASSLRSVAALSATNGLPNFNTLQSQVAKQLGFDPTQFLSQSNSLTSNRTYS